MHWWIGGAVAVCVLAVGCGSSANLTQRGANPSSASLLPPSNNLFSSRSPSAPTTDIPPSTTPGDPSSMGPASVDPSNSVSALDLTNIHFLSSSVAYALADVGQSTGVFASGNGGTTWTERSIAPSILSLQMVNARDGWMTGCPKSGCYQPTVLRRTTDGGRTWVTVDRFTSDENVQADFISARVGWLIKSTAAGNKSVLYGTSDGGGTWSVIDGALPFLGGGNMVVDFLNASRGWLAVASQPGAGNQLKDLYVTTDGGKSWAKIASSPTFSSPATPASLPLGGYLSDLDFVTARVGYMSLARGLVLKTQDGGHEWTALPSGPFGPGGMTVEAMSFLEVDRGYILADGTSGGVLWATTDGGQHWSQSYPPVP